VRFGARERELRDGAASRTNGHAQDENVGQVAPKPSSSLLYYSQA